MKKPYYYLSVSIIFFLFGVLALFLNDRAFSVSFSALELTGVQEVYITHLLVVQVVLYGLLIGISIFIGKNGWHISKPDRLLSPFLFPWPA